MVVWNAMEILALSGSINEVGTARPFLQTGGQSVHFLRFEQHEFRVVRALLQIQAFLIALRRIAGRFRIFRVAGCHVSAQKIQKTHFDYSKNCPRRVILFV